MYIFAIELSQKKNFSILKFMIGYDRFAYFWAVRFDWKYNNAFLGVKKFLESAIWERII